MGEGSFEIVFGTGWCEPSGDSYRRPGSGASQLDPAGVCDVVDIRVDGSSIARRADEDSVFFLVRDMLAAVERLSAGEGAARISFYESPHELVLQRIGGRVFLTFYRGGHSPEVLAKDRSVDLGELADGVLRSTRELVSRASEMDPEIHEEPIVAWMSEIVERLEEKRPWERRPRGKRAPGRRVVESTRFREPRDEHGFSFGFRFAATATDLSAPGPPVGNDLNSLLFRGRYAVHLRGHRRLLGEGFAFLQAEKMLASVRQLLSAWEEGRPISVRLITEGIAIGVRLDSDDSLVISLSDRHREDSILVLHDISPWEYADAVLGVGRELRRKIVEIAPRQRRNLRLEAFSREIRSLTSWSRDQRRDAVINPDAERYRGLAERRPRTATANEIGEVSRLAFRERWRIEAEGLELSGTTLSGELALVTARGFTLGVETETGAVLWRRETDKADARYQIAGRDGVVRVAASGAVELIEQQDGLLRWRTELTPRSGGSPVVLSVDHGPTPGMVIAAEGERRLVALDLRTGEPRWKYTASRGGRFALRRHGRLLYVASSDAQFSAIDIEDGKLVWMFPERTRFQLPPAVSDDVLVVPGGRPGKPEGRLFGLDAYSGEPQWETTLNGGALTAPIMADGVALLPVRSGRRYDLVAADTQSGEILWRMACRGWAETCALMALDDRFIVNAAGGVLRSIGARDGEERWTSVLGPTCSDDVPLDLRITLRGGVLFVPGDTVYVVRPESGEVVHSMGGDPPVPDLMQVDPSCAVFLAEESGHLAMYELARRLSVVSGGAR